MAVGADRRQVGRIAQQQRAIGVVEADEIQPSEIGGQALLDAQAQLGVVFTARQIRLESETGADALDRGR